MWGVVAHLCSAHWGGSGPVLAADWDFVLVHGNIPTCMLLAVMLAETQCATSTCVHACARMWKLSPLRAIPHPLKGILYHRYSLPSPGQALMSLMCHPLWNGLPGIFSLMTHVPHAFLVWLPALSIVAIFFGGGANSLCTSDWPQSGGSPPASASLVLGSHCELESLTAAWCFWGFSTLLHGPELYSILLQSSILLGGRSTFY